jgi:hypothetical protein
MIGYAHAHDAGHICGRSFRLDPIDLHLAKAKVFDHAIGAADDVEVGFAKSARRRNARAISSRCGL